jgi:hypothetical protein
VDGEPVVFEFVVDACFKQIVGLFTMIEAHGSRVFVVLQRRWRMGRCRIR